MMDYGIDLHMHSTFSSDGTYTPSELMDLCRQAGLRLVSLTDHNSVRGVREASERAEKLGISLIPGIELDCVCRETAIHLLGYGIDIEDPRFYETEQEVLKKECAASVDRIRLVKETGIIFNENWVLEHSWNGVVTGEMIGEAALQEECNKGHPLMKELYPGGTRSENPFVNFYWDVCAPGKPAYVPVEYMSFERAQELITETGGISVIAHPGQNLENKPEIFGYLKALGISGIEVYSSYHTLGQVEYYKNIAEELGLKKTAGSDFHGKTKPAVKLGLIPGLSKLTD